MYQWAKAATVAHHLTASAMTEHTLLLRPTARTITALCAKAAPLGGCVSLIFGLRRSALPRPHNNHGVAHGCRFGPPELVRESRAKLRRSLAAPWLHRNRLHGESAEEPASAPALHSNVESPMSPLVPWPAT